MMPSSHRAFGSGSHLLSFICSLKKSHFITFQAPQLCGELQEVNEKFMFSVSNWHFCFLFLEEGKQRKGCEWGRQQGEWVSSASY